MAGERVLESQISVFKALAHPTRLKIVEMLAREGKKCVCELVDRLPFDQSTVSKHLGVLREAGIVNSTKEGLNVIYELRMGCTYQFMQCIEQLSAAPACMKCTVL